IYYIFPTLFLLFPAMHISRHSFPTRRSSDLTVGLDEHSLHVRIGGRHVLRELERLVGSIGLHLLQAGFLGDAGFCQSILEALGAGLTVQAGLADAYDTDATILLAGGLHCLRQSLTDPVGALVVVGNNEGDVFAAVSADV